ncbi:hypothetical protein [Streptomyces sp. NBC_01304]|uniref:hypothetical protein n=1 Tax=Streptomyces sp. NBC_01304 TaxID=2903818 RepID=UPI002E10E1C7|nr:hypothetical protein OG430_14185 [Streptomyces sp. NBC_01304]
MGARPADPGQHPAEDHRPHSAARPHAVAHRGSADASPRALTTSFQETDLSTRSVIARPTADGYAGMYVHFDGYPDNKLPLLLAAYQHRFAGDLEAMARHLIDDVEHGWDELGTDLLDGAPAALRRSLTGGDEYPSRQMTNVTWADGTPAERELITQDGTDELEWAYVLHPHGVEVIALQAYDHGPVVAWDTDPLSRIVANPSAWHPDSRAPIVAPRSAPRLSTTSASAPPPRKSARR